MIYYRVALRLDQSSLWKWKSTVLYTPGTLFNFLKIYDGVAKNRLRVFFASSIELMHEMLIRENNGLVSNSVTVERFLESGKKIDVQQIRQLELEVGFHANKELVAKTAITGQLEDERSPFPARSAIEPLASTISGAPLKSRETRPLELLREESEQSSGGDHDAPYIFALPSSMREALAWTRLLGRVRRGELEP